MPSLDPLEAFQETTTAVREGLHSAFPVVGRTHTLRLKEVTFGEMRDPEDLTSQHEVKMSGGSWTTPVRGTVELVENDTGKVLPANAGMSPPAPVAPKPSDCAPRERGDEPMTGAGAMALMKCSPRTRG